MNANLKVRSFLEQEILPRSFYREGASVILKMIGTQGTTMMRMYKDAGKYLPGYQCPYTEKEFLESHMEYKQRKTKKSVLVIRVQMPAPEEAGQSRAAYFCYDKNSNMKKYFSSELANSGEYRLFEIFEDGHKHMLDGSEHLFLDEFDCVAAVCLAQASGFAS